MNEDQRPFRELLKHHRTTRRWSQEMLALESECDHSLVSRVENGARRATREFILKVCAGLDLTERQRDAMLMSAGFMPFNPIHVFGSDHEMVLTAHYLTTGALKAGVEEDLRKGIRSLLNLAARTTRGPEE